MNWPNYSELALAVGELASVNFIAVAN